MPGRTHPSMSTSGGGGYLLHAIHIIINESLPTPIPSYMKQKDSSENVNKSYNNNIAIDETDEKMTEESLEQNFTSNVNNEEEMQEVDNKRVKLD